MHGGEVQGCRQRKGLERKLITCSPHLSSPASAAKLTPTRWGHSLPCLVPLPPTKAAQPQRCVHLVGLGASGTGTPAGGTPWDESCTWAVHGGSLEGDLAPVLPQEIQKRQTTSPLAKISITKGCFCCSRGGCIPSQSSAHSLHGSGSGESGELDVSKPRRRETAA